MTPLHTAALSSFHAACRRAASGQGWPVTAASITGALLDAGGTAMRARDILATVARQLDAIEEEQCAEVDAEHMRQTSGLVGVVRMVRR